MLSKSIGVCCAILFNNQQVIARILWPTPKEKKQDGPNQMLHSPQQENENKMLQSFFWAF